MAIEDTLEAAIAEALGRPVAGLEPLGGGSVAEVLLVQLTDGGRLVAKCRQPGQPPLGLEARMLDDLRAEGDLPVPAVLHRDDDLLLLEHVEHDIGGLDEAAERRLGLLIGRLHARPRPAFGYGYDTLIGPLPQPNPTAERWVPFFAEHRLLHMADLAHALGQLPDELRTRIDLLADQLDQHLTEPAHPALLHGDLWHGNILSRAGQVVALLDPALYWGHPEAELAFLTLFSSVGPAFFEAYADHAPLDPGFLELRRDLYNLYPLLVHTTLFGAGYVPPIERTLGRLGL